MDSLAKLLTPWENHFNIHAQRLRSFCKAASYGSGYLHALVPT